MLNRPIAGVATERRLRVLATAMLIYALPVEAMEDLHAGHHMGHQQHQMKGAAQNEDPHAHHRMMLDQAGYQRSEHEYLLSDRPMIDSQGRATTLLKELDTEKTVLLNFIYTTCTTICPVLSATFQQVQRDLGSEAQRVRMISITIDPEQDTPEQLRTYAARFDAGPQWQFLTGQLEDVVAVQKAFDAYRGAKTNHEPLTFLRAAGADSWIRVEGIASAGDIVKEYRALPPLAKVDIGL